MLCTWMHACVNTGADVNLMPWDMYIKLYNDDKLKHLKPSDIKLGVWGDDQIALLSKCNIYLVHLDTKKPVKVTFYVADKSGSTLLSCATSLKLDLIKLQTRLGVPPPRAKIITSHSDRASPTIKWVTKVKIMFDEMMKSASTTPTTWIVPPVVRKVNFEKLLLTYHWSYRHLPYLVSIVMMRSVHLAI